MKPIQQAEGHGHLDATGKGHHEANHADATAAVNQIGHPFTPMTNNAPVQALTIKHAVVRCWGPDGCHWATYWAPGHDLPGCAHCGAALDPAHVTHHEAPTRRH